MAGRIARIFRIATVEQRQIALMLATGFFMGVFLATYQVTADSLFLNRLGDQLKIGRRGSLNAWITVEGRQGHRERLLQGRDHAHRP